MNTGGILTNNQRRQRLLGVIGQSTAEYAVLLALVAAALIAMQVYLKRSIQGRLRVLADQITEGAGDEDLYQPGGTESWERTVQNGTKGELTDGLTTSTGVNEEVTRYGAESTNIDIDW